MSEMSEPEAPTPEELVLGRLASSGLLSSSGDEVSSRLRPAFADANACVQDEAEGSPSPSLATSLVVAVVAEAAIVVGSLGNARGLAFAEGRLSRLTRDHTALAELLPAGRSRRSDPLELHNRDLLTRALGIGPEVSPDLTMLETRPGALLLLCSEGLWASVTESDIATTLGSDEPPRELGRALLRRSGRTAARSQAALAVCRLSRGAR